MTINDYLPRNITIAKGEPSVEFFKVVTVQEENEYNTYTLISQIMDEKISFRTVCADIYNLCTYFTLSKNELQLSIRGNVKKTRELSLIIMYAFFDNQLFPSIENILNNNLDKLQKDKNITKETLQAFLGNLMTKIFIECSSFYLTYLNRKIINLNEIELYIKELFIPYISVCKSKYIRITTDGKKSIYKNIMPFINAPTISNFLNSYIKYEDFFQKNLSKDFFFMLKQKLYQQFNIDRFITAFIFADNYYNSLSKLFSVNQLRIIGIDENNIGALIKILHENFNSLSLLRYIILYIETIKDYDSFIIELIIKHDLTNIDVYNVFHLSDEETNFIQMKIKELNDFISKSVLNELQDI